MDHQRWLGLQFAHHDQMDLNSQRPAQTQNPVLVRSCASQHAICTAGSDERQCPVPRPHRRRGPHHQLALGIFAPATPPLNTRKYRHMAPRTVPNAGANTSTCTSAISGYSLNPARRSSTEAYNEGTQSQSFKALEFLNASRHHNKLV